MSETIRSNLPSPFSTNEERKTVLLPMHCHQQTSNKVLFNKL